MASPRDLVNKDVERKSEQEMILQNNGSDTEVAAQISIPNEGGWGWVVVAASFCSIFILDGVALTFGALLKDISTDFNVSDSLTTLINSVAIALYCIASPLVSAFINRFGFRACIMCGSVICALSLFLSYFTTNFTCLLLFYGITCGFGFSLINLSAGLVVGYYFEKLRAIAMSVAMCGSSLGVTIMSIANIKLVKLAGWRYTTLLHSGLFGIIYYLGMAYRPLLSVTVTSTRKDELDKTRTVTFLPTVSHAPNNSTPNLEAETTVGQKGVIYQDLRERNAQNNKNDLLGSHGQTDQRAQTDQSVYTDQSAKNVQQAERAPTTMERFFNVVSNSKFPTAAAVVKKKISESKKHAAGCTSCHEYTKKSNLILRAQGQLTEKELKIVQSIVTKTKASQNSIEVNIEVEPLKKRGLFKRLFYWNKHIAQMRPMYRDDAFFDGTVNNLPAYKKAMMDIEDKTGIEYQLAVSRAVASQDLRERKGVFTMAVRRVLATMLDPTLLKRRSFLWLCVCGFLNNLGLYVPYVYLKDRNKLNGVEDQHCDLFVSTIGLSNTMGRLVLGTLACKVQPIKLFAISCFLAGFSTILSDLSYVVYYQYFYCVIFGFFVAGVVSLRSMTIVSLYGLEKLTNGTGMVLMISGLGSLISTPLAGALKNSLGFGMAFKVAGFFITLSSFILYLVNSLAIKEDELEN